MGEVLDMAEQIESDDEGRGGIEPARAPSAEDQPEGKDEVGQGEQESAGKSEVVEGLKIGEMGVDTHPDDVSPLEKLCLHPVAQRSQNLKG
mgnify:CR=1 FL=1